MAARRIYKKPIKSPSNEFMRLIRMERVPAPTAKGQLQTVRKYRLHDEPMDILIIGDEVKGKKGLAVFAGYKNMGYFATLEEAKRALYKKYA